MIPIKVEKGKISRKEVLELLRERGVNVDSVTLDHTEKDHVCGTALLISGRSSKFEVNIDREGNMKLRMKTNKEEPTFTVQELQQRIEAEPYVAEFASVRKTPHGLKVVLGEAGITQEGTVTFTSRGARVQYEVFDDEGKKVASRDETVPATLEEVFNALTGEPKDETKEEVSRLGDKDYVQFFTRQLDDFDNRVAQKWEDLQDETDAFGNIFAGYRAVSENLTMAQKLTIENRFSQTSSLLSSLLEGARMQISRL